MCTQIATKLLAPTYPGRGCAAIRKVWRREELYRGPAVAVAPDVIPDWAEAAYMPNDRDGGEGKVFAPRFRQYMSRPALARPELGAS